MLQFYATQQVLLAIDALYWLRFCRPLNQEFQPECIFEDARTQSLFYQHEPLHSLFRLASLSDLDIQARVLLFQCDQPRHL